MSDGRARSRSSHSESTDEEFDFVRRVVKHENDTVAEEIVRRVSGRKRDIGFER